MEVKYNFQGTYEVGEFPKTENVPGKFSYYAGFLLRQAPRMDHKSCSYKDKLFIYGGWNYNWVNYINDFHVFDLGIFTHFFF